MLIGWGGVTGVCRLIRTEYIERLGPGTNTKHKSKGEALGQSVSSNYSYVHTHHKLPNFGPGVFPFFLKVLLMA